MNTTRPHGWMLATIAASLLGATGCGDDEFVLEPCDIEDPDCPDGTTCRLSDGAEAYCFANCSGDGGSCPEGYTCHGYENGDASCVLPCDPEAEDACAEGYVCELHDDGLSLCAEPLSMAGMVFDLSDLAAIEGARVVATNEAGSPVTDVAVTDAAGQYALTVPSERDGDGKPIGIFTLRVGAADYVPYPYGIRPPIPIDSAEATQGDGGYFLDNPTTDVGLIPLPADQQGLGSVSGVVLPEGSAGTLVVAEGGDVPAPFGFADMAGSYVIFNVPAGSYEIRGYAAHLQLEPVSLSLDQGEHVDGVDLASTGEATAVVSGQVNIVNAAGGLLTSIVLVPESTYDDTFVRGEVPPGLRAPEPGLEPNVGGAFEIPGVPDGEYVVLAAFENDLLVRDPDPNIAGTQIVHIVVSGSDVQLPESFKITEALHVVSPGADVPEPVTGTPTFIWEDDSSEDYYSIVVYNAFGVEVWRDDDVARVTGGDTVSVPYGGEPLQPGMYYQFRATSWRRDGPISTTEDLRGVFYVPSTGDGLGGGVGGGR